MVPALEVDLSIVPITSILARTTSMPTPRPISVTAPAVESLGGR
jgi:hypothetical protein